MTEQAQPAGPRPASEAIVYVRPLRPDEGRPQGVDAENLYALHAANGQRLALFTDYDQAFHFAKMRDMAPVHAH